MAEPAIIKLLYHYLPYDVVDYVLYNYLDPIDSVWLTKYVKLLFNISNKSQLYDLNDIMNYNKEICWEDKDSHHACQCFEHTDKYLFNGFIFDNIKLTINVEDYSSHWRSPWDYDMYYDQFYRHKWNEKDDILEINNMTSIYDFLEIICSFIQKENFRALWWKKIILDHILFKFENNCILLNLFVSVRTEDKRIRHNDITCDWWMCDVCCDDENYDIYSDYEPRSIDFHPVAVEYDDILIPKYWWKYWYYDE
jgi:hypothetical protein